MGYDIWIIFFLLFQGPIIKKLKLYIVVEVFLAFFVAYVSCIQVHLKTFVFMQDKYELIFQTPALLFIQTKRYSYFICTE